jgi:hypothetical protein
MGPSQEIQTQDEVIMSFGRDAAMYMVGPHYRLSKLCNRIEYSAVKQGLSIELANEEAIEFRFYGVVSGLKSISKCEEIDLCRGC